MPTTYSEGHEIRTEPHLDTIEVVQLPNRDAAVAVGSPAPATPPAAPPVPEPAKPATSPKASPAIKAAKTQHRIKKGTKK